MSQILLINPWIYDFAAYDFWAKPLGLLYIAGSLLNKGTGVTFIDCLDIVKPGRYGTGHFIKQETPKPRVLRNIPRKYARYGISEDVFLKYLAGCASPDVVLVTSVMTYWYPGVFRVIELVKKHLPGVPVILGGIYATLCYEHACRLSGADNVFTGLADKNFFQMLSKYIKIDVSDSEGPVTNYRPAIDLLKNPRYGVLAISTGCPYRCSYCASSLLNPSFQQKHYEICFNEIKWMNTALSLENVAFYDDALLHKAEEHFIPLMNAIGRSGLRVNFHTPNGLSVRGISLQSASLLKKSGFRTIRLGMETTLSGGRRVIDGKTSYEELLQAVSYLKEAGFQAEEIGVYLLCGLPGQDREEVEESMRIIKEAGARPYLSEFSPIPGTRLWEEAVKVSPYPIKTEPLFHNPSLSPCAPEGFSLERRHWRKNIL